MSSFYSVDTLILMLLILADWSILHLPGSVCEHTDGRLGDPIGSPCEATKIKNGNYPDNKVSKLRKLS